jgi:hypothetical protein
MLNMMFESLPFSDGLASSIPKFIVLEPKTPARV